MPVWEKQSAEWIMDMSRFSKAVQSDCNSTLVVLSLALKRRFFIVDTATKRLCYTFA